VRVRKPNPDGKGRSGILIGDALYVSSKTNIWISEDRGEHWVAHRMKAVAAFAESGGTCYAVNSDGIICETEVGRNAWKERARIADVRIAFDLAAKDGRLCATFEKDPWNAYAPIIEAGEKSPIEFPQVKGRQAYEVAFDDDGRAWVATDFGLFREAEKEWVRVWPSE